MTGSTLLPKDVLLALCPSVITRYLTSRGWSFEPYGAAGHGLQFRNASVPGADLLLPINRDLGDYEKRMVDLVVALTTIERRPIWETLDDLSQSSDDVLDSTCTLSPHGASTLASRKLGSADGAAYRRSVLNVHFGRI
jgi:hypothetical protein